MSEGYVYDHAWTDERIRLEGLEFALDPGTREHLIRLGVGPGSRCLEIGAGGGSIAFWLTERASPGGEVVAIDLETDFLEREAARHPGLRALKLDITTTDPPSGFDLVHARYLVEWLPDKLLALQRMVAALRPGGVLLDEEPDWITMYEAVEPLALRRVVRAAMQYLESTSPVEVNYGRRVLNDLSAVGLVNTTAEARCQVIRGKSPPASGFLRLTLLKLGAALLREKSVTETEFSAALEALEDSTRTFYMPMTVAAWGWRT